MPWRETSPMDERLSLISDWKSGDYSVTELSGIYNVSRKTVYKWTARYGERGLDGLKELSRAPHGHPNETSAEVVARLVDLKRRHMKWGPKKLLGYLRRHDTWVPWPSVNTAEKWLRRYGLVSGRKSRKRVPPYSEPFVGCDAPNDVWSTDYKGQFRTGDGLWCYPLTISDNASRYVLDCRGLFRPEYVATRERFEWAFREFGLPRAIRSDNGTPFAGRGWTGLSRLSVWWIRLGIRPERIESGKPQQNGRHERMHRTLKEETAIPPASDMRSQQRRFDRFLREYNVERPHEALGQRPPSDVYARSSRRYPEKLRPFFYDEGFEVRRVKRSGEIKFKSGLYYLSELLSGENVGLKETDEGKFDIMVGFYCIGVIDLKTGKTKPKPKKV